MDDDEPSLYSWEGIYERPWEAVVESTDGSLRGAADRQHVPSGRTVQVGVKRGMLRALFMVVDASRSADEGDAEMRPSRLAVMIEAASAFVASFFEQNPISTLAVIAIRDGRAELLAELSCNARQHLQALTRLGETGGRGEASLQNALELAREALQSVPRFTSREVVVLSASLSTCDPGDILATVGKLKRDRLRVSVFSLLAEVYICRKLATDTGGEYGVPVSAAHLRELVLSLVPPRPSEASGGAAPSNSLLRVGFPRRRAPGASAPTLAFAPGGGLAGVVCEAPYRCPQCDAAHTEIPTQCQICTLKLMSSVELTKTYHHLFPVPGFRQATRPAPTAHEEALAGGEDAASPLDLARGPPPGRCFACAEALAHATASASKGGGPVQAPRVSGFECPGKRSLHPRPLALPSLAWPGLAWPWMAWPAGLAWPGLALDGLACWPGLALDGLAWPGLSPRHPLWWGGSIPGPRAQGG